jgi:ribosomal protein S18 acetylase RimI-like enzyme
MGAARQRSAASRVERCASHVARAQANWIVAEEPWSSLGYERDRLGSWLACCARSGNALVAREDRRVLGIVVTRPDVLLGVFIALLAVRPEARGRGLGRLLVEHVADGLGQTRWLYSSSDSRNRRAARFYRALGFERVGRLPDLIQRGRAEILWRRPRDKRVDGASRR